MTTLILLAALALAGAEQDATPPKSAPAKPASQDNLVTGLTVKGGRQAVETSLDRRSYSVASDLAGKSGTVADVLRNVPSVQVDVQGNVSLRGDGNVTVLVDGRPSSQFTKDNLATALQTTPADQIDRIEVITNPSAEFRADGSAGIINLVMKKARGAGRTGSLRVNGTSTGSYDSTLSSGLNTDRLSLISSLTWRHGELRAFGPYEGQLSNGDISRDQIDAWAKPTGANGRIALDYDLDKTTRLSSSVSGARQAGPQVFLDHYVQTNGSGLTTFAFDRRSDVYVVGQNAQLDLTLRKKWDQTHSFTLNAAFSDNEGRSQRIETTTPAAPASLETVRNNYNRRAALTADYQKQIGAVQLKTGYLVERIDNLIEHAGGSGASPLSVVQDPAQTDNFGDVETHNNAYVTLQKKVGKLTALGGLRAETVHLDLDQKTLGLHNEQDYQKLYPTLHLGYALGGGKTLTASYSKRVTRPIPVDLDPFRYKINAFTAGEGNPALKPQDTDSYELIFETRKGEAFTLMTAYYRQTNNAFSNFLTDLGNGVLLQSRANLGYQSNTGVEWTTGNRLSRKLTYNASVNLYQVEVGGEGLLSTTDRSAITSFGRANLNWQISKKDMMQFNVFATGKQLLRQGYIEPNYSGNIGYRHAINDKAAVMLIVRDPFATSRYRGVFDTGAGRQVRTERQNTRAVSLAVTWNFAGKSRDAGFDFGSPAPSAEGGL